MVKKTPKPKRRKQLSGAQKLKAYGRRAILLGVWPEDHERLSAAAQLERRPLSQFIVFHAMQAAERLVASRHYAKA